MNNSLFIKHQSDRTDEFRPNKKLVELIERLRLILEPIQIQQNQSFIKPKYPVVVIVGCPRSGSTLLSQVLASSGSFSYPTNFLSRFAYAPLIGALIQQMIFDPSFDFRGELNEKPVSSDFISSIGKTNGALGINEFFHFWRKFFPVYDPQYLNESELEKVDTNLMRSELAAIESVFNLPFLSKGKMMQFNIVYFAEKVPELFFIYIKRDSVFNMQSLLLARRKYYGSDKFWYSVKPKEYHKLSSLDSFHQIAGQVFFTEQAIENGLSLIPEDRKLFCRYEDLCQNPNEIFLQLKKTLPFHLSSANLPSHFKNSNNIKTSQKEIELLQLAYQNMQSNIFM